MGSPCGRSASPPSPASHQKPFSPATQAASSTPDPDKSLAIFQDRQDIKWGEQWRRRIHESLDDVTFLVPIITPGFFASKPCREELELFLKREKDLGRSDLILPIYYIDYPDFNDTEQRGRDPLMAEVAKHQYEDWRELRHEPLTSAEVGRKLSHLAEAVRDALNRRRPVVAIPGDGPSEATPAERGQAPAQSQTSGAGAEKLRAGGGTQAGSAPAAKSEPPTLVVNPFHRGDYTSISDAVRAAKPGTVIKVEPGLYQEGLVIDKPLEIVGQGAVGDVVIEAADKHVILFQATMGRVANVALRQLGGKFHAVDIAQGRLDLEDCDITSQGVACVGVHGGADPRLRRNRIHDGKGAGVYVHENGRGTLEDNDIFANSIAGVVIGSGGDPTLRRNRIHGDKGGGVLVFENGRGTLEDNDVFANAYAGVQIKSGGDPTLRRNRIHDGKQGGVFVNENGRGTLEDNDIFANAYSGVDIRSGGDPILRRNRIHKNDYVAVRVYGGGAGAFEDNDLTDNQHGAWYIAEDCREKVVRRNNKE